MTTKAPPSQALVNAPPTTTPYRAGPGGDLVSLLRRQEAAIAAALPRHVSPERFTRVALTALRTTRNLDRVTPASFLGCLMTAAQLGLEPNTPLGHAYLIPFKDECTFILGYKGIIDLARRNGVSIVARTVYDGDDFTVDYGLDESIVHRPTLGDRGDPIAYYGIARWDGGHMVQIATVADIEQRRARSKASKTGPWTTDFDAMAKKTTVRMMAPYLPLSVEMATAVAADERPIHFDLDAGDFIDSTAIDPDDQDPDDVVELPIDAQEAKA